MTLLKRFKFFKKYQNLNWDIKKERERDRKIIDSFNHAIEGIIEAIRREKHMKVHVLSSILVVIAAILTNVSRLELIMLSLTICMVLIAELINTSIEAIVDLISPERHDLAKLSKDVAAAGVLIAAINAMIVGYLIFYDKVINVFNVNLQMDKITAKTGNIVAITVGLICLIIITLKAFWGKGTPLEGGMPSGHSAIAFSIFAMVLFFTDDPRVKALAFMMAVLVAQSRVKSQIHSFKEVFIGGLIGFLVTFIIFYLLAYMGRL